MKITIEMSDPLPSKLVGIAEIEGRRVTDFYRDSDSLHVTFDNGVTYLFPMASR